jgi:chemotaxis protein CheX
MSAAIDMDIFAETIRAVAEEVFAAMVDGEPGMLVAGFDAPSELETPTHAWVDMGGSHPGRVIITTEHGTAMMLTRALLGMGEDEAVADADFVDAVGEIANVVGGNVKALVPDPGPLSMPEVAPQRPEDGAMLLYDATFLWRGLPLGISLWSLS